MIKRNHIKQGKRRTPARKIAMSFFMVIVVGTLLLMLPAAHRNQQAYPFVDALFTATSATCVTGLVIDVTLTEFTLFGQVVIMTLIQIGGLGLMTIVAVCILFFKSKLTMHEKITMKEMLNQDGAFNMKQFLKALAHCFWRYVSYQNTDLLWGCLNRCLSLFLLSAMPDSIFWETIL